SLAREFLEEPALTTQRFIRSPIQEARAKRLLETGDIARYLSDGSIELIRAGENNAEIGEWNVDLQALQKAISEQSGIKEAAILLRESPSGEKTLIAYVVPTNRQRAA